MPSPAPGLRPRRPARHPTHAEHRTRARQHDGLLNRPPAERSGQHAPNAFAHNLVRSCPASRTYDDRKGREDKNHKQAVLSLACRRAGARRIAARTTLEALSGHGGFK
ncbi:hypothetical protein E2651_01130 [Streptomyces sp. MZ04]|nr:hypothetical protein E2651_01130 [Streptomyces sp. MZ04]